MECVSGAASEQFPERGQPDDAVAAGGKTYATLNRSPGGNDPATITDPAALEESFLWPRGYTTVWSGWENALGPLTGLIATAQIPVAKNLNGSTIIGPAYEYIV